MININTLEPIFFFPIEKDYVWGGKKIYKFKKSQKDNTIAESWEISANANGDCVIQNDFLNRVTLSELFRSFEYRKIIFGKKTLRMKQFPILIKFIDAKKNLSIQVHPDDRYAQKYENAKGKNEMWYIVDCSPKAELICGFNKIYTKKSIINSINNQSIQDYLKYIKIKKGDSIYIPAGTVHAILKNCFVCEIQQNSDLTYRLYDWNRKDSNGNLRTLHTKKAMENIKILKKAKVYRKTKKKNQNIKVKNFKVEDKEIVSEFKDNSNYKTFYAVVILKGKGEIISNNFRRKIKQGDSFLIPSYLGEYKLCGKLHFLKISI